MLTHRSGIVAPELAHQLNLSRKNSLGWFCFRDFRKALLYFLFGLVAEKVKFLISVDFLPLMVHLLVVTTLKIFLPIPLALLLLGFKLIIGSKGILWIHFLVGLFIFHVFLMINFIYKIFNGPFNISSSVEILQVFIRWRHWVNNSGDYGLVINGSTKVH